MQRIFIGKIAAPYFDDIQIRLADVRHYILAAAGIDLDLKSRAILLTAGSERSTHSFSISLGNYHRILFGPKRAVGCNNLNRYL